MKKINLFFVIFFLFSSFCFAWSQQGHDVLNSYVLPVTIGNLNFSEIQTVNNNAANYLPISVDLDSDGNEELIVYNSNLINIYKFNSSQFNLWATQDATDLYSGFWYDNKRKLLYANSLTTFYGFSLDSSGFGLIYSKALSNNAATNKGYSVNCLNYDANTTCILKESGYNYEIFTILDGTNAILSLNYSSVYTHENSNYEYLKPALFPDTNGEYRAILTCNQSGRFGVLGVYLNNGSIWKQNCTYSAYAIDGSPKVNLYDGINWDILFSSRYPGYGTGISCYQSNRQFTLETSFPMSGGSSSNGGCLYQDERIFLSEKSIDAGSGLRLLNKTGGQIYVDPLFSAPTNSNGVTMSGSLDYLFEFGALFKRSSFRHEQFLANTFTDVIIVNESNIYLPVYIGTTTMKIFYPGQPIINQINASVYFADNTSKQIIQSNMFNTMINLTSGSIYLGLPIPMGNYTKINYPLNISVNITSLGSSIYLPYNKLTNLNYGYTSDIIIYLIQNISGLTSYSFGVYNANTGENILDGFYSLYWLNLTSSFYQIVEQNKTLSTMNDNLNIHPGNYTLTISSLGQFDSYSKNFYLGNAIQEAIYLTPRGANYGNIPRITESKAYTYFYRKDTANNLKEIYEESPNQICLNQDIWINFTALKLDVESFNVKYNCGGYREMNPYLTYAVNGTTANLIKGIVNCIWNETGNKTIKIWAKSGTFAYTLSDFDTLFNSGLAKKYNVAVIENCSQYINVTAVPKNDDVIGGYMGNLGFESYAAKRNIAIVILIIIFLGCSFGISIKTGNALVGLLSSAIATSLGALFFFAVDFISPSFLLFILLICVVYGVLSVIFGNSSSTG